MKTVLSTLYNKWYGSIYSKKSMEWTHTHLSANLMEVLTSLILILELFLSLSLPLLNGGANTNIDHKTQTEMAPLQPLWKSQNQKTG